MIDPITLYILNITTSFTILQKDTILVIHSNIKTVITINLLMILVTVLLPLLKKKKLRYTIPYPNVIVENKYIQKYMIWLYTSIFVDKI